MPYNADEETSPSFNIDPALGDDHFEELFANTVDEVIGAYETVGQAHIRPADMDRLVRLVLDYLAHGHETEMVLETIGEASPQTTAILLEGILRAPDTPHALSLKWAQTAIWLGSAGVNDLLHMVGYMKKMP